MKPVPEPEGDVELGPIMDEQKIRLKEMNLLGNNTDYIQEEYSKADEFIIYKDAERVILDYGNGSRIKIGLTDGFFPNIIVTNFSARLDSVFETSASCLTPQTSSCSPSMILHQLASLLLASSIKNGVCMVEENGNYQPDIMVKIGMQTFDIDICGHSIRSKLKEKSGLSGRTLLVINKYLLVPKLKPDISMLVTESRKNDSFDLENILQKVNQVADHVDKEVLYTKKTLSFFKHGKDMLSRKISDHNSAATKAAIRILRTYANKSERCDNKNVLLDQIDQMLAELREPKHDNDYFCLPVNSYKNKREFEEKPIEGKFQYTDGIMMWVQSEHNESERKLFLPISSVGVHEKTFMASAGYVDKKMTITKEVICKMRKLLEIYKSVGIAIRKYHSLRITSNTRIKEVDGELSVPKYSDRVNYKMYPCKIVLESYSDSSHYVGPIDIDPEHRELIITSCGLHKTLISVLSTLRDYHELRFRARISVSILSNYKKKNARIRVNHWYTDDVWAEVAIQGMVLEKDRGLAIVSYFSNWGLFRTEVWRLPDIENYSIAHHRLVALLTAFLNQTKCEHRLRKASLIYSRILSENSWGLSKFLKVYRYYSTGWLNSSPLFKKTGEKLMKSLDKSSKSKLSVRMLMEGISVSNSGTPFLNLPSEMLGWEIFLVNLCPSKTYGKLRHQTNVLQDLYDELKLYNSNLASIGEIYKNFDQILETPSPLEELYWNHFNLVIETTGRMDLRFSFSPASIVLIEDELAKIKEDGKIGFKKLQNSLPHITELMTSKASFDPYKMTNCNALESISTLVEKYSTESTSILCAKILSSGAVPHLIMRMFDKDQVGGDREISILSSEFRILQVISESFFKKISSFTDNEFLNRKDKKEQLVQRFQKAMACKYKLFNSIDQTRWGPNFNTITFGLMCMRFFETTTEAYYPALICLMSEFKSFEVPSWIPSLYKNADSYYKLVGMTGRSHMGQGIFHNASSVYHSFVTKKIESLFSVISSWNLEADLAIGSTSFVTSDDVSTISYVLDMELETIPEDRRRNLRLDMAKEYLRKYESDSLIYIETMKKCYTEIYERAVLLFGIKTNDYKNVCSNDSIEFNSEYLSSRGIGSNEIKFVYSLVDPTTTGSFLNDYRAVIDSFFSSINSGATVKTAFVISKANYLKFCRQWKLPTRIIPMISESTIKYGMPPTLRVSDKRELEFRTESSLKFKTRKTLQAEGRGIGTIGTTLLTQRIESMIGTRERSGYRSCITHHSGPDYICNYSNAFRSLGCIGESYSAFIYQENQFPEHYEDVLNGEVEVPYNYTYSQRVTDGSKFQKVIIRRSQVVNYSTWELVTGYSDPVPYINAHSSDDQIMLHLLRDKRVGDTIYDPYDLKGKSIIDQLVKIKEIFDQINLYSSECVMWVFSEKMKEKTYQMIEIVSPIDVDIMSNSFNTFRISNKPNYIRDFGQSADYIATLRAGKSSFFPVLSKQTIGRYKFVHGDHVPYTLSSISLEEINSYVDLRLKRYEEKWRKRGVEEEPIYLNMKLGSSIPLEEGTLPSLPEDYNMEEDIYENDILMEEMTEASSMASVEIDFLQSRTSSVVSVVVDRDFSVYNSSYYKRILLCNAVLNRLIKDSICHKESYKPGFIMDELEGIHIYDKNIPNKISKFCTQMSSRFASGSGGIESWSRLIKMVRDSESVYSSDGRLREMEPIFKASGIYSFSNKPNGKLLKWNEFWDKFEDRWTGDDPLR